MYGVDSGLKEDNWTHVFCRIHCNFRIHEIRPLEQIDNINNMKMIDKELLLNLQHVVKSKYKMYITVIFIIMLFGGTFCIDHSVCYQGKRIICVQTEIWISIKHVIK